ncbi:MAG TPA: tetratricopeptide repeat protein, partial [Candidatus Bathyarchaeia archaeon]|nr:tetratricopeptide repeat protein [Candidatus Bathyarchaeia archaeon]
MKITAALVLVLVFLATAWVWAGAPAVANASEPSSSLAQADQKNAGAPAGPAETNYQSAQQFIQAGNYEEAIIRLKTATSIKPDYLEAWALLGSSQTKVKNLKEGIDAYERALALSPGNAAYISAIAYNYRFLENWDKAEEYYTKLVEKDSLSYDGHVNLGFICERKDNPDQAIRHYEKAVAVQPADAATLHALAALYEKQGKEAKSMECLQRAVAAAPD